MILIKNGLVKTMVGEDIENGQILIDGKKIVAVGKEVNAPTDVEVIDATGCIVTPGLIDGHCHVGMMEEGIGFEGNDVNEITDPITAQLRAIDAINPMDEAFANAVAAGVTTSVTGPGSANVVGGTFLAMKNVGKRIDDMIIKNPVAMKCAFGENPKRCYNGKGRSPSTRMATAATLRTFLAKSQRYMEELEEAEKNGTKKPAFDAQLEAMLPVMRKEIPLKAHAHRADDIFTSIRIAKEFGLKITLDHCTEGHLIVDELVAEGLPALVGPSFGSKSKYELREKSFKTPGILNKAGMLICIITDANVIPLEQLPMCAGMAVKAGMDEAEAWKAITINPAKIIGIDDTVGSLEVGKDADIAIYCGNPLTNIDYQTKYTLIDGKVVYKA